MVKCGYCKNKMEDPKQDEYANGVKFRCFKCGAEFFTAFKLGDNVVTLKGDQGIGKKNPYGGKVVGYGMWGTWLGVILEDKSRAKERSMFLVKNCVLKNSLPILNQRGSKE